MEQARVAFLQSMPIFGGLCASALETLVGTSVTKTFDTDDILVAQDDPPGEIYILEQGTVRVLKKLEGREYDICKLGRGDCIGEMSLIDPHPRSATVKAAEYCTAICLGPKDFYHLRQTNLAQFTVLQLNIARELARRLRTVEARLFMLLTDKQCGITV